MDGDLQAKLLSELRTPCKLQGPPPKFPQSPDKPAPVPSAIASPVVPRQGYCPPSPYHATQSEVVQAMAERAKKLLKPATAAPATDTPSETLVVQTTPAGCLTMAPKAGWLLPPATSTSADGGNPCTTLATVALPHGKTPLSSEAALVPAKAFLQGFFCRSPHQGDRCRSKWIKPVERSPCSFCLESPAKGHGLQKPQLRQPLCQPQPHQPQPQLRQPRQELHQPHPQLRQPRPQLRQPRQQPRQPHPQLRQPHPQLVPRTEKPGGGPRIRMRRLLSSTIVFKQLL